MSTAPTFAATAKTWAIAGPTTADTSLTAPSNSVTLMSAASTGSKIEQIRVQPILTNATGYVVNIFLHDGSTYFLFEAITIPTTLTVSNTSAQSPIDRYYSSLVLPTGWSVRVTVTTSAGQSATRLLAFGGDF